MGHLSGVGGQPLEHLTLSFPGPTHPYTRAQTPYQPPVGREHKPAPWGNIPGHSVMDGARPDDYEHPIIQPLKHLLRLLSPLQGWAPGWE